MRSSSVAAVVVATLNELFDTNPQAIANLLDHREVRDIALAKREVAVQSASEIALERVATINGPDHMVPFRNLAPGDAQASTREETIGLLDVINTLLAKLAEGKQVGLIQGANGLDGFVLARQRPKDPEPTLPS